MSVVVLGSDGMLGHVVAHIMSAAGHNVVAIDRSSFNVGDNSYYMDGLCVWDGDIVINCIGVLVDESAKDKKKAVLVNSLFPHKLSEFCDTAGARLIHITTDCVFDGRTGSYEFDSRHCPSSAYGMSKSLGEPDNCILVRTSIYGPELKKAGTGLLHWFLTFEGDSVNGFVSHYFSGVSTVQLAKKLLHIVDNIDSMPNGPRVFTGFTITKSELLSMISSIFSLKTTVKPTLSPVIDRSMKPWQNVPPFANRKEEVRELLEYMKENRSRYLHYGKLAL